MPFRSHVSPQGVPLACALPVVRSGGWYHATNRSVDRAAVFPEPQTAAAFVAAMGEIAERFEVEIHAYCAMGNHYHLLARADEDELLRAIERLEAGIRTRVGRAHLRRLALGRHLLGVTRYIHRNPVEGGLVRRAEDWPWSSYRGYLDGLDAPHWLRSDAVLGWLGSVGRRQRYKQYVERGLAPVYPRWYIRGMGTVSVRDLRNNGGRVLERV